MDTDKGGPGNVSVRGRLVARDFKGNDKDRDDLFAETPPLEGKRLLLSMGCNLVAPDTPDVSGKDSDFE